MESGKWGVGNGEKCSRESVVIQVAVPLRKRRDFFYSILIQNDESFLSLP